MNLHTDTLTPQDLAMFAKCWISPELLALYGVTRVGSQTGAETVGRAGTTEDCAGLLFPIFGLDGTNPIDYLLRRDAPPVERRADGSLKEIGKYLVAPCRGNPLLLPPGTSLVDALDVSLPILIVEGVKKLMAAHRLAMEGVDRPRFLAIGINGVWGFRGKIGRVPGPDGDWRNEKGVIPALHRFEYRSRNVWIALDSDVDANESSARARDALARQCQDWGARTRIVCVPSLPGMTKTGVDDWLAEWGPDAVWAAIRDHATDVVDPEPVPLDLPPLPTLDENFYRHLVPWVGDMVLAMATALEVPPDFVLWMALGILATATQRAFTVRLATPEGESDHQEVLALWTFGALESGNLKSAVLELLRAPLDEWEGERREAAKPQIAAALARLELYEDEKKRLKSRATRADDPDERRLLQEALTTLELTRPIVPSPPRLWAGGDITMERLVSLTAENGECMSVISDEGGVLNIAAGRYSNGVSNIDFLLQGYSGSPVRVDRVGRDKLAINLKHPVVSLVLAVQPSVLRDLLQERPEFRERGFLSRPLFLLPDSTVGRRTFDGPPIPSNVKAAWRGGLRALLAQGDRCDPDRRARLELRVSREGLAEWREMRAVMEYGMADGGEFEELRDWGSKMPGQVARIFATLHCAQHAHGCPEGSPIALATVLPAIMIGAIAAQHAKAAYQLLGISPALKDAQRLWRWIEAERKPTVTAHALLKQFQGRFKTKDKLAPALTLLVNHYYVFPVERIPRPWRPSETYRVNPVLMKGWAT